MRRNKTPYFSIIVPSYNQGDFLKQTLDSISQQSFRDWEVIITDGGSTDESVKIIKEFFKKNPNKVLWRSRKDSGQVEAINEGIKKSRGRIIAYLNSDDYYAPECFLNVFDFFKKNDMLWAYGRCAVTQKKLGWTFFYKSLWPVNNMGWLLYFLNPINQPSVFINKKLIRKVGLFDNDYKLAFDYDYWIRCLKYEKPGYIDKYLSVFRVHKDAKSSKNFTYQFNEEIEILKKNKVNIFLCKAHELHNLLIVFVYRFLK